MDFKYIIYTLLFVLYANQATADYLYLSWDEVSGATSYNLYTGGTPETMVKTLGITEFAKVPNSNSFDALVNIEEVEKDFYVGITASNFTQESKLSNVFKLSAADFVPVITTTTVPSVCDIICK